MTLLSNNENFIVQKNVESVDEKKKHLRKWPSSFR